MIHDSVVTLAFAFVTLTPNIFAFAIMSTLFLDETACEILLVVSNGSTSTVTIDVSSIQ